MSALQSFYAVEDDSTLNQCVELVIPCAIRLFTALRAAVDRQDVRDLLTQLIDDYSEAPSAAVMTGPANEVVEACKLSGLYESGTASEVLRDLLSADLLCEATAYAIQWYHDMPEVESRCAAEGFRKYWNAKFRG